MDKVPCRECGALILPTTAGSTGGICMACKQGIRRDIDQSRAYYAHQKAYDPVRELWLSLVTRSSSDESLASLSRPERLYFATCLLDGEIYNGGFDQYFHNSSADYYRLAVEGLREIGASQSLNILQEAAETLFGTEDPPVNQEARWRIVNTRAQGLSDIMSQRHKQSQLERLDKDFSQDPDQLGDRLTAFAERHGLVRPFEKPAG